LRNRVSAVSALALCFALTLQGHQYSFDEVSSGLKHKDPNTRIRAIRILKEADYQDAVAPIGDVLGDPDDRVQLAAIDAEGFLFTLRPVSRHQKVGYVIEKRTTTGDAADSQLALKPRTVPPQVLAGLVLALIDRNPEVRGEAISLTALLAPIACRFRQRPGDAPCAQIGNAVIENINSKQPALRRAAMQALGRLQYPNAVQALLDQFSFHKRGVDAEVAFEALARVGHVAAVTTFEEHLQSSDADIRRLAVEGIARTGYKDSLYQIQQLGQTERSGSVLLAIHFAMVKLSAPGADISQVVNAVKTPALRPFAIDYLLDLGPSHASSLATSLRDQDPAMRRLMADVLGFSADPAVIPALTAASKDADPDVVLAAQRAIERLKL